MKSEALKFLRELMATPTPSGYEMPGQKVVAAYMKKYADAVSTDVHGNVTGVLNPKGKVKIMLAGHCDEIGLMIMYIDKDGFLYFSAVGGVNVQLLQGERVLVHGAGGPVPGVIGVKPIHLMDEKERQAGAGKISSLWIDIGAKDKADAEKYVALGDVATVNNGWTELKNDIISARGFDDRIGAFVVADVLRSLKGKKIDAAVYAVSTVQEEIGLRGATTASKAIQADIGIAVDVGFATDAPNMDAKMVGEAKLGAGPILHRGPNFNHHLHDQLQKAAKKKKIPVQQQPIPRGSGTDANAMQLSHSGCATALISVPNRYMHSPVEVVHLQDVENTVALIAALVEQVKAGERYIPQ